MASYNKHEEAGHPRTESVTHRDDNGQDELEYNTRYNGKKGKKSKYATEQEEYSDEEREQTIPMMPRADDVGHHQMAAGALSHLSTGEDQTTYYSGMEAIGQQQKPTGKIAWVGFGLAVCALTCMCLSFASPYWIQQWDLSFSTFENMGLWEVCFHNYMHHRDDLQEIYNGCFWVFDSDEKYSKLRDWLLPPWFLACQVMATVILLVDISVVVVTALVFLHMCPMMNHEYHQIFAMFISGAMMFLSTMTSIIIGVLFGVQIQDRNWMPRPDWNFLSWGFGFLIISGIMSLGAGICLFYAAWSSYNELLKQQDQFFKHAMEMSSMYPTSYDQPSYGAGDKPGYTDQPSYDPGEKEGYSDGQSSGKPSYHSQPSYEKQQSLHSQPSYEKQPYEPQSAGYDQGYAAAEPSYSYDKPAVDYSKKPSGYSRRQQQQQPAYDANRSYESQRSYDANRSYDSQQGYDQGYGQPGYGQPVAYDPNSGYPRA